MNLFLGITSYSDSTTSPERIEIIRKSLMMLKKIMPPNLDVVIFVDGNYTSAHQQVLIESGFKYRFIKKNLGIGNNKSFCIKYFLDNRYHIGLLADDDIYWKGDIFNVYANTLIAAKIKHLCFLPHRVKAGKQVINADRHSIIVNNITLNTVTNIKCGVLLTFTRDLIEKIGFFRVLPYKYGGEHEDFSRRATALDFKENVLLDIPDSHKYIEFCDQVCEVKSGAIDMSQVKKNVAEVKNNKLPFVSFPFNNLEFYMTAERALVIILNYNGQSNDMTRLHNEINGLQYRNVHIVVNFLNNHKFNTTFKYHTRIFENKSQAEINALTIPHIQVNVEMNSSITDLMLETISRAN